MLVLFQCGVLVFVSGWSARVCVRVECVCWCQGEVRVRALEVRALVQGWSGCARACVRVECVRMCLCQGGVLVLTLASRWADAYRVPLFCIVIFPPGVHERNQKRCHNFLDLSSDGLDALYRTLTRNRVPPPPPTGLTTTSRKPPTHDPHDQDDGQRLWRKGRDVPDKQKGRI